MLSSAVSVSSTSSATFALVVSITSAWSEWIDLFINLAENRVSEGARLVGDHSQRALLDVVKDVHAHGKGPGDGSSHSVDQERRNRDSDSLVPLELGRVDSDSRVSFTILVVGEAGSISATDVVEEGIRVGSSA